MRAIAALLELLLLWALLLRLGTLADDDDELDADDEEEPKKAKKAGKAEVEGSVIGIDLGTTFSCVAVMKKSGVEIIPNDQGNRITPSYVAFTKTGRLIGEAAKNEASEQPSQTMFDIKRLIGRRFEDATVKKDMESLPFKIVEEDEKLKVAAEVQGVEKTMAPEEVSAIVLEKMKEIGEAFLGDEVKNAVITVPAYFTNAQREATKDAGLIAGLNVLRIINEPTAAALAYGLDKKDESNILVYDLGGGTFDVSLLTVAEGVIEVVATNGDTHLGGEDFDQRVAEYLQGVFEEKHGKKVGKDKKALNKLKQAAEKAKIALSSAKETTVDIESLADGIDFQEKLSRAKFEELNVELFKQTLSPVKLVLEDGKMKKGEIDEIVLVGGSTRIPKVQALLKEFFNGKEPNTGLNPDEAVAYGAAVQGGILSGIASEDTVLLDVTPISIGIETAGGLMDKMITRNSAIPVTKTKSYETSVPDAESTHIKLFEGERPLVKHNNLLGQFILSGFPKGAPRGLKHDVTLDIDVNGIMTVSAKITDQQGETGKEEKMTISKDKSRLTQEEIDDIIKKAEEMREEDAKETARAKAVSDLDIFIKESESKMKKVELLPEEKETVDTELKAARELKSDTEKSTEDITARTAEIKEAVNDILGNYNAPADAEDDDDSSSDFDDDDDSEDLEAEDHDLDLDDDEAPAPRPSGGGGIPAPGKPEGEL